MQPDASPIPEVSPDPVLSAPAAVPLCRLKDLIAEGGGLSGFAWPESCGSFDIRITRDGAWHYRGSLIARKRLCQLFATVLQRDDAGVYWLVTPAERGRIEVEDAPFLAVELAVSGVGRGRRLAFRTTLDHWITAGPDHPIILGSHPETGAPRPGIPLRDGLEARLSRPVFYELAALAEPGPDGSGQMGVWGGGLFHPLEPAA